MVSTSTVICQDSTHCKLTFYVGTKNVAKALLKLVCGKGSESVKAGLWIRVSVEQFAVYITLFCYRIKYKTAPVLVYEELLW